MQRSEIRLLSAAALAMVACAGLAIASDPRTSDEIHEHNQDHGLPFFDIRLDQTGAPSAASKAVLEQYRTTSAWKAREAEAAALLRAIPTVTIDPHPTLASPHFIRSTFQFLTPASKADAIDVVTAWVGRHSKLLELTPKQLAAYPINNDFVTSEGLMRHLGWQQTVKGGVEVFMAELRANVTGRGELINIGSTMVPVNEASLAAPVLSDLQAFRAAAANLGVALTADPVPGPASGVSLSRTWQPSPEMGNQDPVESKLVYFPRSRASVVPAWYVVFPVKGPGNTYEMVVDAVTGEVLWRHNRLVWDSLQPATYRVFTSDSPAPGSPGRNTPDGGQFPLVARSLVTIQPAEITPFSPNGWIPDGANTTSGNNVMAYSDASNDNTADAADFATGTPAPARVFDFPQDLATQAPSAYRDAAITQLFYLSNRYHDRLLAMGFDEAARNFQTVNFSGQGVGGDAVRAEAQDGSGTNNANFGTSGTDGSTGRCQMYVWTGPNPDRDGDFDADIVFHELSHGLSIRLHRGLLSGTQQTGGMGEGWGDFFGVCLNAEAGDNFNAVYAMGAYSTLAIASGFVDNYYFGIRRFPHCTDMTKSPLTYADCHVLSYDAGIPRGPVGSATANQVHNVGEIWCASLLECRAAMAAAEGFNANNIIMQLAVDGMKLITASGPNFIQERDAILQADLVRYGGVHQPAIWEGFAKRGVGFSASSGNPPDNTSASIVEAFDTPQRVIFTYPDGLPDVLGPGAPVAFRVDMTPFNLTITPGSQQLFYSVNGGAFSSTNMTQTGPGQFLATIPGQSCFADVDFYASTGTSVGQRRDPQSTTYGATVNTGVNVFFTDTFETNLGWTGGQPGDTATTGVWERAVPQATSAQPGADVTPAPGTICWVTGASAGASVGANDIDGGFTTLLSPALPLAGRADAQVSYWRWYSNNQGSAPNADTFRIEVSANGSTGWTAWETVGPVQDAGGGWVFSSRRLGDVIASPTNATRFRFIADDAATGSVVEAALDDFLVSITECTEPSCDPDYDQNGVADQDDVAYLINVISGGPNPTDRDPDFDGNGVADQDDVAMLINVIAGAACP